MHPTIQTKRPLINRLCRELGVRRLDLFGSAAGGSFDPDHSDVDVLVEFDPERGTYFDRYFALKEGLEEIFERPVDVVIASGIRNPFFRNEVMRTKELLYAA